MSIQAQERRVRRVADKLGYRLHKLRDGGGYWLLTVNTGGLVIGQQIARGVNIGYDIGAIEDWLRED
jgi:hypothetical protein